MPRGIFRTSNFPNNARATLRGSRLKNDGFRRVGEADILGGPIAEVRGQIAEVNPKGFNSKSGRHRFYLCNLASHLSPRFLPWQSATVLPTSRALQILQHFLSMALGFYVVEDVFNLAIRPDDKGGACNPHDFVAVHVLFFDYTELAGNLLVRVRQQREGQTELVLKLLLRRGRVGRNPQQHRARLFDLAVGIAEAAGFLGAAGCVGFWIK